jgi:hypothetical protein
MPLWVYVKDVLDRLLAGETDDESLRPNIWKRNLIAKPSVSTASKSVATRPIARTLVAPEGIDSASRQPPTT